MSVRLFKRLPAPLLLGLAILALMAAFAIAPGAFTPYDPLGFDFSALLGSPPKKSRVSAAPVLLLFFTAVIRVCAAAVCVRCQCCRR